MGLLIAPEGKDVESVVLLEELLGMKRHNSGQHRVSSLVWK